MTVVFIFWGQYGGFKDALACAKARSGCRIHVISDQSPPAGVEHTPISEFQDAIRVKNLITPNAGVWASHSLSRWFILRDFAIQHPEAFPIFCADWDVLIFNNLLTAYAPFNEFDYTVSRLPEGMESAAYGVNRMLPLQAFCEEIERLNRNRAPLTKKLNDMEAWSINRRKHNWNVGNLYEIKNLSVFDHSMHCGAERFESDGEALRVNFDNGHPFFTQKSNGGRIMANTLHCWGSYKGRTKEMREKAGVPL